MKKVMSLAPSQLPPLSMMVDDLLGDRSPESVGRFLGVSALTVRRWLKSDQAPRAALLALFWETRWGRSAIDADRENLVRTTMGLNSALRNENAALKRRIARLEALSYGAANAPSFHPENDTPPAPVVRAG